MNQAKLLPEKESKTKKHDMYNDVLTISKVKFAKQMLNSGVKLVDCTVECLWTIDGNHNKFHIAASHGNCKGLNWWQRVSWLASTKEG